jgi:hypothetical protein
LLNTATNALVLCLQDINMTHGDSFGDQAMPENHANTAGKQRVSTLGRMGKQ